MAKNLRIGLKRIMAIMLVLVCFAGYSELNAQAKVVKIRVMYDFNVDTKGMSILNNKYVDYIKEKTGVQVQIEAPGASAYDDKMNIVMASGNYPDAVMVYSRDMVHKFGKDGILTDLAPYINNTKKYPNIKKYMPADAWIPITENKKIWAFPYNRPDGLNQVVYVRKEWMKKLNLKTPRTIDEFYEVMKAFTYNDPDGNGKNDTFGLLSKQAVEYKGIEFGARMFMPAFDCASYKIINGKVTPPEITPNYKDYLKFIKKLVDEKIMDPEYAVTSIPIYMDKLKTGKYGMTSNFWHADQFPEYRENRVHEVWDAIEPPLKRDGKPSKFTYPTTNRHYMVIPKGTKNIAAIMKLFDWAVSPEGRRFINLGIENKEYKIENGKVSIIEQKAPFSQTWVFINSGIFDDEIKSYFELTRPKETVQRLELANKVGELDKLYASLPYYPELATFNLAKIVDEYREKVILGGTDIDKTWNDYVAKWRKAGGDKAITYWTAWYKKYGKNIK